MKLQVGVKVLIRNSKGAFLLLKRTSLLSTDASETSWDIPGGRIEPDEKLADALKREVKEEVGHDIHAAPTLIAAQDIIVAAKELHVVRLTYVLDEDVPKVTLSDEHDDYRWVALSETESLAIDPYVVEVLADLK